MRDRRCYLFGVILTGMLLLSACAASKQASAPAKDQEALWHAKAYTTQPGSTEAADVFQAVAAREPVTRTLSEGQRTAQYARIEQELELLRQRYAQQAPASSESLRVDLKPVMDEVADISQRMAASGAAVAPGATAPGTLVIPARSMATWTTEGLCLDEKLPAPGASDRFQLIPIGQLIHPELISLYQNLVRLYPGEPGVERYAQQLAWMLRGVDKGSAYSDSLGQAQKNILDRCAPDGADLYVSVASRYAPVRETERTGIPLRDMLSMISVFGMAFNAADLLNPERAPDAANQQVQALIRATPMENSTASGYEYAQLAPGVYTHITGAGPLTVRIRLANVTASPFAFDPTAYAAQAQRELQRIGLSPATNVLVTQLAVTREDSAGVSEDRAFVERTMQAIGDLLIQYQP